MIHIGFDARMAGVGQGGLGRYAERVVRAWGKLEGDFRITLFLRRENWDLFDSLDERFVRFLADVPWYGIREQMALPGIFKRAQCDVYHVPHFNVPLKMPKPFVFTLHDLIMWEEGRERDTTRSRAVSEFKAWGMKAVVRRALKRCAACIAPSQWTASRIEPVTGIKPKRVEVIYEGADALLYNLPIKTWAHSRSTPPPSSSPGHSGASHIGVPVSSVRTQAVVSSHRLDPFLGGGAQYILTVGNAYKHKNIPLVIDAVAELKDKFPTLHHIHAGPEHPKVFYENLMRYGTMKLGGRFHHLGNVPDGTLAALYQSAVMFVAPSSMEGFALPALEAMRCGTPVIAARASCFPEVLGEGAYWVPPGDSHALAHAIAAFLNNAALREQYAGKGKARAIAFTWEKHARKVMEIYRSVTNVKPKTQNPK